MISFAGYGGGTAANPYLIYIAQQLDCVGTRPDNGDEHCPHGGIAAHFANPDVFPTHRHLLFRGSLA